MSAWTQGAVLAGRNVLRASRNPASISGAVAAPIVFLLGFLAVMGRTMDAQGIDYVQYLTPAVVVQTMLFAAMSSGYYVADDEQSGLMARTRSLPLSPAAPVIGRAGGDAARSLLGLSVLTVVGTVVGFRYHGGPVAAIAFWVLAVSFAVALSLGTGLVGLRFGNPRATLEVLNMAYLPLLMISTAFVPAERFPSWLEGIVAHQPVSRVADALRTLSGPDPTFRPVLYAVAWVAGMAIVFGYACARTYGRPR